LKEVERLEGQLAEFKLEAAAAREEDERVRR
jgi:hypothetical protein